MTAVHGTRSIIEVSDLSKSYWVARHRRGFWGAVRGLTDRRGREVKAVDGISFGIEPGEVVGFIGPNGAGKSTTIKMLTGILVPSAGTVRVAGFVPWQQRKALASKIGVVFGQKTQLWWDLPLIESLSLLRYVYRVPEARFRENLEQVRELLKLDDFLETPVRQLSLGQRMRGDLAASLLHDPPIVFLDEPTIGLDVVAKVRIREFLTSVNRDRGATILLTTHDLQDVAHLCQRLMIIDHGHVLYDGSLSALQARFGEHRTLVVDLDEPHAVDGQMLAGVPGTTLVRVDGLRFWLRFDREAISASDLIAAVSSRWAIRDVSLEEPAIEEIIRGIYEFGLERRVVTAGA